MSRKLTRHYEDVLRKFRDIVPGVSPSYIMVDFEASLLKAVKKVFPGVEIVGCWFHYMRVSSVHPKPL